ncbi:hypothetical protein C5708_03315 [Caulobacter sp. CCUG 60055]|uniref:DUF1176 domain-containing protein n=2 Tax=Pseudomonadota TaxID=1224 RepID=UPI001FA6BC53|nr:DUF1176 domain-containing protein [Caulobacter sp. CCUG 60055]MBQ1540857.1 DUF1176 domain-containing protein [Caulobacteraceae bacterium]MCI3179274.1 hypothetical protein [Caulobacter sp. CCUG 60055]
MRKRTAAIAALSVAGLVFGAARAQETKTFKSWSAACDNARACTAFGFTEDGSDQRGFLRIQRQAGPAAAPAVSVASADAGAGPPKPWTVKIDGRTLPGLGGVRPAGRDDDRRIDLSPTQASALIAALRNGGVLTVEEGATPILSISLAGSTASLLWIDDRQGRAGGATALVARGAKPAAAVPPPPALPVVRRAPPVAQSGLPAALPKSLARTGAFSDCDSEGAPASDEIEIHRLSPGVVLFAAPCMRGAYNLVYGLMLADERGRRARLADLPLSPGSNPAVTSSLMNIGFDPKTQTLTSFGKGRGPGDCGESLTWVWDGAAFRLVEDVAMSACKGVGPDDWPTVYRAVVR